MKSHRVRHKLALVRYVHFSQKSSCFQKRQTSVMYTITLWLGFEGGGEVGWKNVKVFQHEKTDLQFWASQERKGRMPVFDDTCMIFLQHTNKRGVSINHWISLISAKTNQLFNNEKPSCIVYAKYTEYTTTNMNSRVASAKRLVFSPCATNAQDKRNWGKLRKVASLVKLLPPPRHSPKHCTAKSKFHNL